MCIDDVMAIYIVTKYEEHNMYTIDYNTQVTLADEWEQIGSLCCTDRMVCVIVGITEVLALTIMLADIASWLVGQSVIIF